MLDLDFGAYAPFVIGAYAATALVLGWMVVDSLLAARRCRLEAREKGLEDDWA
jgi:heme exporter protein CcmD